MAGNTRQWAKDKLDSTVNHLRIAGDNLASVAEVYAKDHPEIELVADQMLQGIILEIECINHLNSTI